MEGFSEKLNELLMSAFQSVLKIEEQALHRMGSPRLSISEAHLLEVVGKGGEGGRSMSELAKALSVAPSSISIAIQKLEGKGMLKRTKGEKDARIVWITLTEAGSRANRRHTHFHEMMVSSIAGDIAEDEQIVLLRAMQHLNEHFERRLIRKS